MIKEEFLFNFKFNLHKSAIPIGIADEDYDRLSVVYGVSHAEMLAVVRDIEQHNKLCAQRLCAQADASSLEKLRGRRLAFLGDSISCDRKSHVNILRTALGEDAEFANFAVSGFKIVDVLTALVPAVPDFRPDAAHIMIGSNDMKRSADRYAEIELSAEEFCRDLRYIVSVLQDFGVRVLVSTIPPFDAAKVYAAFHAVNIDYREADRHAFNDILHEQAEKLGFRLNDMEACYGAYATDAITEPDGLHLNALGQQLLAKNVLKELANLF